MVKLWEDENAQVLESYGAQGLKGRTDIGAFIERATAAIENKVRRARNTLRPLLQIVKHVRL
jgi:hypothetical protein